MKKLWYTETSRDKWWPVFTFKDWDVEYVLRLAGNPILLLEKNYELLWWTEFMKNYNLIKNWQQDKVSKESLKLIAKAKSFCEDFFDTIRLINKSNKSTFVIYK